MPCQNTRKPYLKIGVIASLVFLGCKFAGAQEGRSSTEVTLRAESTTELQVLASLVRVMQAQIEALNSDVTALRAEQQRSMAEARELRHQLNLTKTQSSQDNSSLNSDSYLPPAQTSASISQRTFSPEKTVAADSIEERIGTLEEHQELTDAKLNDQYQTKVESGSKYRVRLSGIVLLNMFDNRGTVDNLDLPEIAMPRPAIDPRSTFGGALRQSQIGIEAFGPEIAGAHTSADLTFDFAGGFPGAANGVSMGIVRLRTGTIRLDWAHTSLVAGQDRLFFSPLAPTSFASLAIPALSYAGNLWSWTPQVRIEHRIALSDDSSLLLQGGILDAFTGELPKSEYNRFPTWGESSGRPAVAARAAWSYHAFGEPITLGVGGYYGRQKWGFGRNVDGWAATSDLNLPLGKWFDVSAEFYRGKSVGGLGGGIGQSVLLSGSVTTSATSVIGLDSVGGWIQLKFNATSKLQFNGAFGQDNPFASELNRSYANSAYFDTLLARNRSWFVNFVYQPRSDVVFSIEQRRLSTFKINSEFNTANQTNVSLGYIF